MLMKNASKVRVACEALGWALDPGQTIDVDPGYCAPRKGANGEPIESIIEMLVPQLIPADEHLLSSWKSRTIDVHVPPPPPPTAEQLVHNEGLSPGVAELAAAGGADTAPRVPRNGQARQGNR